MKKTILFITLLLMTAMMAGCSGDNTPDVKEVNWVPASYDILDFKVDAEWQLEEDDILSTYYITEDTYIKFIGNYDTSPINLNEEVDIITESIRSGGGTINSVNKSTTALGIDGKFLEYSLELEGINRTVKGFCFVKDKRSYHAFISAPSSSANPFLEDFMKVIDSISINEQRLEAMTKPGQDQPFNFGSFSITIGSELTWDTIANQYNGKKNVQAVKVPIKMVNTSNETDSLTIFDIKLYGAQGTGLEDVSSFFNDALTYENSLRPGAEATKYLYLLYDGDGDYYVEFENYTEHVEVKIPITK